MGEEQNRKFEQAVTERLEPYRAELVATLRRLIEYQYGPQVGRLHFEVYCDQFTDSFPVSIFYLDHNDDDCPQGDSAYPDIWELLESEGVLEEEFLEQAESDDFDMWTASGMTLIPWFANCWQLAGGGDFPLQASIRLQDASIYDGGLYFNLVRAYWEQGIVY